jgi:hypothetical protein
MRQCIDYERRYARGCITEMLEVIEGTRSCTGITVKQYERAARWYPEFFRSESGKPKRNARKCKKRDRRRRIKYYR